MIFPVIKRSTVNLICQPSLNQGVTTLNAKLDAISAVSGIVKKSASHDQSVGDPLAHHGKNGFHPLF